MEELYAKMAEYVKMEEQLPFAEFQTYYQSVIDYLMKSYQDMGTEDLIKAKGVTMIMANNAKARARLKDANRKKFLKIGEKSAFWEDAIKHRLIKEGMDATELDEKVEALWAKE
jgi:hypothetical protein